jgi:hypothetical protein
MSTVYFEKYGKSVYISKAQGRDYFEKYGRSMYISKAGRGQYIFTPNLKGGCIFLINK